MAVWMVRAGKDGEREDFALANSVVVAGDSKNGDLSKVPSREELEKLYHSTTTAKDNAIRSWAVRSWNFVHKIEAGDLAVLPLKTSPSDRKERRSERRMKQRFAAYGRKHETGCPS